MKRSVATSVVFAALTAACFAQGGPLTPPPGAPAPTMKSLDQVEPRIPLIPGAPGVTLSGASTLLISAPGSYYLTGNLNYSSNDDAVRISSNNVTLDLMGYTIAYTGSSQADDAIEINGNNVEIRNGNIRSTTTLSGNSFATSGFGWGVYAFNSLKQVGVKGLKLSGMRNHGIALGVDDDTLVEGYMVRVCGSIGVIANSVYGCQVDDTSVGVQAAVVKDCRVNSIFTAISAPVVESCHASSTSDSAIKALETSAMVSGSTGITSATGLAHRGIDCSEGSVRDCFGKSAGSHGIQAVLVHRSRGESSGDHRANSCGIRATQAIDSTGIHAELGVNCSGHATNPIRGGVGIRVDMANGCRSSSGIIATYKDNMPQGLLTYFATHAGPK